MDNKPRSLSFVIQEEQAHQRVDFFLSHQQIDLSRSRIKKLLEDGLITINGLVLTKPAYSLRPGDEIVVELPEPSVSVILPENIPLDLVYEDEAILVVNKPAGMVVHPAVGNYKGTLVNALLFHSPLWSGIGGVARPGIVHRLDKDTSGLLVVAKTDAAHLHLSEQIKARTVKRIYRALVYGVPSPSEGEIKTQIGRHISERKKMSTITKTGRIAITTYAVEEGFGDFALLRLRLQTGRTHQIRVHLNFIKHPIIGDKVYGHQHPPAFTKRYPQVHQAILRLKRQALHAQVLGFVHPVTLEYLEFTTPLPDDFANLLEVFRNQQVLYRAGRV